MFYQLTLLSGAFGFLLVLVRLLPLALLGGDRRSWTACCHRPCRHRVVVDRCGVILGLLFMYRLRRGQGHSPSRSDLFTKDQKIFELVGPNALSSGVWLHAIVGTLEQVGFATVLGVPVAVATAVFLNEVGGRGTRLIRTVVTAMSGHPR